MGLTASILFSLSWHSKYIYFWNFQKSDRSQKEWIRSKLREWHFKNCQGPVIWLTRPAVWASVTSKVWRDKGRTYFSPPHSKRQKIALLTGWCAQKINSYWTLARHSRFLVENQSTAAFFHLIRDWEFVLVRTFIRTQSFNPFAPEPPVTARADPRHFYPLWRHQF